MPIVITIDKSGAVKQQNIKEYKEDELYKKAGFKTGDGFMCQTTWAINVFGTTYSISVFGKTSGRAGQENKYDFPPPVDNSLFFGTCVLVNKKADDTVIDLTSANWEAAYDHLFGGFEDIGDKDSDDDDDESQDDDDDDVPRTKAGYVKDGFVVDDDDVESEEEEEEDDDESEEEDDDESEEEIKPKYKKKTKKPVKTAAKKSKTTIVKPLPFAQNVFVNIKPDTKAQSYLDCASELVEEPYFEEDKNPKTPK